MARIPDFGADYAARATERLIEQKLIRKEMEWEDIRDRQPPTPNPCCNRSASSGLNRTRNTCKRSRSMASPSPILKRNCCGSSLSCASSSSGSASRARTAGQAQANQEIDKAMDVWLKERAPARASSIVRSATRQ